MDEGRRGVNLFKRIAQKIARRFRTKGIVQKEVYRPNRNRQPETAVDLWIHTFGFKETPAKRAGYYRAEKRKQKMKKGAK
jgi:hypothetical protein